MRRLKLKIAAFFLFILVLFLLTLLKLNVVHDLPVWSETKLTLNKLPFVSIASGVLAFSLILFFEKRFDFWAGFNFVWIFTLVFIVNLYFITDRDYELVDYGFSEQLHNYKTKKYREGNWINTQFIVGEDTLYFNQNPELHAVYRGDYVLYKSRFQKFYYLKASSQK